ncbi:type IV secretory system conjugative DNA transfer family protein [Vibrio algivorus]|uniref:MFS transporter n=1 Tax=Vibrio algivorus TaxID=1667024 RepID=A0A557PGV9_9VIBR|nr:type IV secretion system DNA-binding domain-containing protein [Vibrio algivorus]TVO39893.1 MFS transporter [Vibrio algivorus]
MLELLSKALLSASFHTISSLYKISYSSGWIWALLAGLLIPCFYFDKPEKDLESSSIAFRFSVVFSLIFIAIGTLSPITIPALAKALLSDHLPANMTFSFPLPIWCLSLITIIGIALHVYLRRWLTPKHNELKMKITQKTKLARNEKTDVREIATHLPTTEHYDPMKYIDLKRGVFIGLDELRYPQYIPLETWQTQHADIIGTTGAGKGVASGILLYQSILADEGVFVLDPKNDEWAPHLYRKACEDAGKPFYLIDLNKQEYQINLLADITTDQLEELLVAGFSLAEKGDVADFYRIDDRKAARVSARLDESERKTLRALFNSEYVQSIAENIKAFYGKLEELAGLDSINAVNGVSLQNIFDEGGCCYVIGSMRNGKIIAAQRMLLVRLLQIAETRDRIHTKPRPIAIFLDELKYHLSKPAMEGLGAARDKGVHIIMAHQSIADLKDCPADLNGDAVVGAVVENAKFKLVYKLQDPDTAKWVAEMSGTILVDDETRKVETSKALTESIASDRSIRQAERNFIDTNMLLNLPKFVSFIYSAESLPFASLISPIRVQKSELILSTKPQPEDDQNMNNNEDKDHLDFDDNVDPDDIEIDDLDWEENE